MWFFPKRKMFENPDLLKKIKALPCAACGSSNLIDPAHIRSRGAGGDDYFYNVVPLCREHHTLQHAKGWQFMLTRFPLLVTQFKDRGWLWGEASPSKKLFHENFDPSHTIKLMAGFDVDIDFKARASQEE